jgi:phosphoserine phosphatase RsbU/P
MFASTHPFTVDQVLQALQDDGPYLFLGSAFTTVGMVTAVFAFVERKFNAMLFWLGIFSILYGLRLCLQRPTFELMFPPWKYYDRLRVSINYLVPIPAFFYFDTAGFLGRRGRRVAIPVAVFFTALFAATWILGFRTIFDRINSVVVIGGLCTLLFFLFRQKTRDKDFRFLKIGLITFVAGAFLDNFGTFFSQYWRFEPMGFAFFLETLLYVAVRRTLRRDKQLSEIHNELEIARRIQTAILPGDYPKSACFEVAARYCPMTSVAGDLYDFLVAEEKQAGLLVADVSGHGVPAALIASMVKLAASSQRANAAEPAALLAGMNQALFGNTQNQFVTAAYVHLDVDAASLRYSAAAHPPMLLLRDGKVASVEENGLMLAAFAEAAYTTAVKTLERGDRLVLYTDGILEAANAEGTEFGQERLGALLVESRTMSPKAAVDHVIDRIQAWSKVQSDDLTVLICDYGGDYVGAGA